MADTVPQPNRKNQLNGYRRFVEAWAAAPTASMVEDRGYRESAIGNKNADGTPECDHARVFRSTDARFLASLEPGVRDLVATLVGLGWITYTSCEGHPQTGAAQMRRRNVGLLPRDPDELRRIQDVLEGAIGRVMARSPSTSALLGLLPHLLETDEGPKPCLDIVFYPKATTWPAYRRAADEIQQELIRDLTQTPLGERSAASTDLRRSDAIDR